MSYPQEFDFDVIKENYTRWRVSDRTVIKAKFVLRKFSQIGEIDPLTKIPGFAIDKANIAVAMVPDSLKNYANKGMVISGSGVGEMLDVEPINEDWQEYRIANGFKLSLRPVITKVFRYNKYDALGEPIYEISNIQMITDLAPLTRVRTSQCDSVPKLATCTRIPGLCLFGQASHPRILYIHSTVAIATCGSSSFYHTFTARG